MMTDKAPDALILPADKKVSAFRLSKWPLYVVLLAGMLLIGVLIYSVNFAHVDGEEERKTKKVDIVEEEKPLLMGEGKGLALKAPAGTGIIQMPMPKGPDKKEPLLVVQESSQQADQHRQELDNIRRMKMQAQLTALSAPLGVKKASDTKAGAAVQATAAGQSPVIMPGNTPSAVAEGGYDPAAVKDKEAFFDRAKADNKWILPNSRTAGQPLEVKAGGVIPAALITGINSELPGQISAQVTQNVYDTSWGRHLLIPQGAKLTGVYDARVVFGQKRVLIAWNRVVFPDGSAITLEAMPGADMSGNAGFTDEVDNHYFRIFGSAVLMSMVTGGMAYTMDSLSGDSGGNSYGNKPPTLQQEMGSALAAQMGQASLQLLQKNLNIAPTLEIRPGYTFNVVVTKDVVFERPYKAWR